MSTLTFPSLMQMLRERWYALKQRAEGPLALVGGGLLGGLLIALVAVVGVLFVAAIVMGTFALVTILPTVVIWALWNFLAPNFDAIPVAYQHFDFLVVWAGIALLMVLRGLILGQLNKR